MTKTKRQSKLEKALQQNGIEESEAVALIKSARGKPHVKKRIRSPTAHIRYGAFSDPHIGSKYFDQYLFEEMIRRFNKEGLDFIVDAGDHAEGMSGRPGHIYELEDIGYNAQLNHICELYNQFKTPIFGIDGNHDQWFKQKGNIGAVVGEDMERRIKNYTHLGEWEGDLDIGRGNTIKLFHANDGTAYATSYKIQKLVESFSGGEKPNIVHSGHYHKALYAFIRNVHAFETGTICDQTGFMRGKKLPAHKGYWIVDLHHNKFGIQRLIPEFVPAYD